MDTQKNNENIIINLKRQIGKLMVQVDFLYRNGRDLSQFDYDILMDRTRELYEYLIDCQAADLNQNQHNEENRENTDNDVDFEVEIPTNTIKAEEKPEPEEESNGLILTNQNGENEDDEEDWEDEEDIAFCVNQTEIEVEKNPVNLVNPVQNNITSVDKTANPVDDSLAARLQRQPVSDIKSGIMLNDRVMMINELFKGSTDRYSKAINDLNDFPTLGGALVYMSELRVELQWDIESEAYMKLQELVQRRFL